MRVRTRWLAVLVVAALLSACGGGAVNVSGTWSGTATCTDGCGDTFPVTFALVQSGAVVSGTINNGAISSGTVSGAQVTLVTAEAFTIDEAPATFSFVGSVQGNAMTGNFTYTSAAGTGGGNFTANK